MPPVLQVDSYSGFSKRNHGVYFQESEKWGTHHCLFNTHFSVSQLGANLRNSQKSDLSKMLQGSWDIADFINSSKLSSCLLVTHFHHHCKHVHLKSSQRDIDRSSWWDRLCRLAPPSVLPCCNSWSICITNSFSRKISAVWVSVTSVNAATWVRQVTKHILAGEKESSSMQLHRQNHTQS